MGWNAFHDKGKQDQGRLFGSVRRNSQRFSLSLLLPSVSIVTVVQCAATISPNVQQRFRCCAKETSSAPQASGGMQRRILVHWFTPNTSCVGFRSFRSCCFSFQECRLAVASHKVPNLRTSACFLLLLPFHQQRRYERWFLSLSPSVVEQSQLTLENIF